MFSMEEIYSTDVRCDGRVHFISLSYHLFYSKKIILYFYIWNSFIIGEARSDSLLKNEAFCVIGLNGN